MRHVGTSIVADRVSCYRCARNESEVRLRRRVNRTRGAFPAVRSWDTTDDMAIRFGRPFANPEQDLNFDVAIVFKATR